ncbi:MAG: hypothetical protein IJV39_01095 [Ruminococcus sp.]|nr:hypothetical protein [Ruminococcus sp.]
MTNLKKVLGYRIGDFKSDDGNNIHFVHLFCAFPTDGVVGLMAEKFKVDSDDVLDGVQFGDYVELYFNDKKKIVLIQPVAPTPEDLKDFHEDVPEPSIDNIVEN